MEGKQSYIDYTNCKFNGRQKYSVYIHDLHLWIISRLKEKENPFCVDSEATTPAKEIVIAMAARESVSSKVLFNFISFLTFSCRL